MDALLLLLTEYLIRYPESEIDDVVKLLYQQQLGTGHAVPNFDAAHKYISKERENLPLIDSLPLFESIGNNRFRLHLNAHKSSLLSSETIARLFTAQKEEADNLSSFINALDKLSSFIVEEHLPFVKEYFALFMQAYRQNQYPSLHHSSNYKKAYSPAYRVVGWEPAFFEKLLLEIESKYQSASVEQPFLLAIDGRSGSGKSSLAAWLHSIYPNSSILSMDDFFLPQHLKTLQRLGQPGGNIHYELVLDQVLIPLKSGKSPCYTPFNCQTQQFDSPTPLKSSPFYIFEGSYSLHPKLFSFYDLSVFLTIPKEVQEYRIFKRNGSGMLSRFLDEWIPLEETYFSSFNIQGNVNFLYDTSKFPNL